jgi:NADPH:quinone reductase-like Zn-dependent oxidoreductase
MRGVVLDGGFGLDRLVVTDDLPDPEPGPGEVRVRVRATSLNYRDLLMVRGEYNPRQPLPLVPLSDGAGEVDAVGPGVSDLAVGDRVAASFHQAWPAGEPRRARIARPLGGPLDGMLRERVVLPRGGWVRVPEHLYLDEAATLPCAAVTAWTALERAGVGAGDTVLVQGTGGVSVFALQLAKLRGARVIATSSAEAKRARARELGADEVIDYVGDPNWGKTARGMTGGEGVDAVIEVGGAQTLAQSLRAVRPGGTIALIGILTGNETTTLLTPILMQQIRVQGILVGSTDDFEAMNRAIALHGLRPVVDRVFPREQIREAFDHMAGGAHLGKIVVRLP